MKLHLPIALLTAVVSAMSYAHADINRELSGTPVTGATQGDLTVTITGNDDYTTTNMYYNKKPGYIGGAAHYEASGKENTLDPANGGNPADRYSSLNMIVGGEGSDPTLKYLMLEGLTVNSVVGDKSVTVNSGTIEILYGGIVYLSGVKSGNLSHTGNAIGTNYYPYKDSSNPANTSITINGGTVGHIRGGHSGKQEDYVYKVLSAAQTYDKEHGTNTYGELMADKPWSISGDVNIAVNGGVIDAASAGKTTAIMGAGGSGHSVDGTVKVSVSGGTVLGDIFAGSNNIYSEVGATRVEISGGAITGNVYGGGDIDNGRTDYASYTDAPAPTVKGGTTVVLSGGTIDGNVYAAGVQDIVNAGANNVGTHVVISGDGTEVTGTISGQGLNSTVVGERLLTIENSGGKNVNWNKIDGFNAVEFKNSQIHFGTLSQDFEKVSAENSHLVGKFEDGEVQLNANDSWLEIAGNLTTTKGSSITNTDKPMTVTGDATFKGTIMENADLVVDGDIAFNNDSLSAEDTPLSSSVTNSNLVAGGNMSFQQTTMNGGTLSVGGELSLNGATVVVDSINNGNSVLLKGDSNVIVLDGDIDLNNPGDWGALQDWINGNGTSTGSAHAEPTSLTVNSDLKLSTGSSFKGSGDSSAKLTANSITTDGAVTFEKSDVKATQGDIALSAGSKVTEGSLTAAENVTIGTSSTVTDTTVSAGKDVTIGASSTVSGSKITATAGDITVSGSTVSDTDLTASNGTVSLSGSTYNNDVKGANYISGDTVKIADTTISSTKGGLFIKGDTYVTNGDFVVDGAVDSAITFSGDSERVFDANSSITAITGNVRFGADKTPSGVVISNGAEFTTKGLQGSLQMYSDFIANNDTKITAEKGGMSFYGDVTANDTTSIKATGGNINFFGNVTANAGTTITATGGKTIAFSKNVNLDGSELTADNGKIEFNGGLVAKDTTFTTNSQANNTFIFNAGEIRLDGGNKLIAVDGTNGTFAFRNGANVIANGANTIDGVVTMADGAKLTAQSGTLDITTRGSSSLNNVQQTGGAQINVTANGGSLNLKGTSTIESLKLNDTTSNITGCLTTTDLVSNGGIIKLSHDLFENNQYVVSLRVNGDATLTDTTLTNEKGYALFKGNVETVNSRIESKGSYAEGNLSGSVVEFRGPVVSTGSTYIVDGEYASMSFTYPYKETGAVTPDLATTPTLRADANSKFIVEKGTMVFGYSNNKGNGLIEFNGSTIESKDTVQFHTTVNANEGTTILAKDGTITFNKQLNVTGGTITAGNVEGATTTDADIFFNGDVAAKDTDFNIAAGNMYFKGDVALNGGNTLTESGDGALQFTNSTITAKGNNVISGNVEMLSGKVIAESGELTITNGAMGNDNGLDLRNVQIADKAAEGTKINVVVNGNKLAMSGDSTISNLALNQAKAEINGDLTADNAVVDGGSLIVHQDRTVNLKNVALTDGSSVSNTGETLELGAATVSGSVSIKHNTDGTTKIGGITKTDDSASVSLSQTGGTVEFNGGKGTVAEIDWYNSDVSDAAMVQSGDGTVNVGHVISTAGTVEFKQTGNGEMNFGGMWININTNSEINQTGKGHINFRAGAANVGSVTQSGGGTFTYDAPSSRILSLDISNGSTFEAMCSVTLDDVAISDATLFNAGTMTMDSLVMDNATLLFAASALDSCSSFIFNGDGGLTGYGISNVSAADMIKEFGVVMSGDDARDLLQQWGSEVEFSFTLAQGSELFEKEFAYVLEQNLAEFTITLGEAAELSFADGEIKDITVEDTENGVVVKGIAVIPEPTTATLSLLALAALAARRRRK